MVEVYIFIATGAVRVEEVYICIAKGVIRVVEVYIYLLLQEL